MEKVLCQTPTPGKQGTRIHKWKYDLIRSAILQCVPKSGTGVAFKDLPRLVSKRLSAEEKQKLGSVSWYTTSVKLDMETKGELRRLKDRGPQKLLRN